MLDCLIRGGMIVDGSGAPSRRGDIGISGGRIVSVGKVADSARRVVDATGLMVAPGFIDVHTHYDAQVMWDPSVAPSSLHGVTTIVGGNCGFTIAPVSSVSADYVMRMLACVEGMPVSSLEAAIDFGWETFGDWLSLLEGRLAVNAGFLVGHSTIRRLAMGEEWQQPSNERQLAEMARLIEESVAAGALGFSSSWGAVHGDHMGNPVPSRFAGADEMVRLAGVLHDHPGTVLEFIPPPVPPEWPEDLVTMMTAMSASARAPLNWNLLTVGSGEDEARNTARLAASDRAREGGGEVVALMVPRPVELRLNLLTTIVYNGMPTWQYVLTLAPPERLRALRDSDIRQRMARDVEDQRRIGPSVILDFDRMTVQSVAAATHQDLTGRLVGDLARERAATALDTFLDIAVADDLLACYSTGPVGDDAATWRRRAATWRDPRVLIGGSDAGAHVDMLTTFAFCTDFLGPTVRDRQLISIEEAVRKITREPAQFYGLSNRGLLAPGFAADVVIFDADRINSGKVVLQRDMPDAQYRLFAPSVGIEHVLVNGVETVDHGELTGATPATVLRSGRDTGPRAMQPQP
jgi:N-acyl-D-aspartate/D-glutamate deacylase